jgi:transposase
MQCEEFVAADVSKDELVLELRPERKRLTVVNSAVSIKRFLRTLKPGTVVGMESTGRYHRELADQARQAGMRVYVLNAKDVWFFARGEGQRGKTDRLDAGVIAEFLITKFDKLREWAPGSAEQQEISKLLRERDMLVVHSTAMRSSLQECVCAKSQIQALERRFAKLLEAIDARILGLVRASQEISTIFDRLLSIPGFGPLTCSYLATLLTRIPFENVDAFIAYSGLDPRPQDSGKKRGARHITKRGPALLRKLVFNAARSACRTHAFKPIYQSLRQRRFASTEAFVILARRLLRIAWATFKTERMFDPAKVPSPA